ncbi:MAG: Spy/CpxP family protein refolding chaperone [Candidatus Sericytochromatia bacterium]
MLNKIAKGLFALISISIVGACAANTVTGVRDSSDSFNVLGNEDNSMNHFGKGNHFKKFMKDLNLTNEQKEQFKALKQEMKSSFNKDEMKSNREAFKNILKEAFLSEKINKDDLKSKLQALKPKDDKSNLMAVNMIKAYNILNPEQKAKVENKLNDMESKFQNMGKSPMSKMFGFFKDKRFDWMTSDLNLNETQKSELKSLLESGMGDRQEMFEKMKNAKNNIFSELKSSNPNVDKIANVIKDMKGGMESKIDSKLDKLVKLHDTLNLEQRQKLVSKVESMIEKMKKHHRGHFKNK